MGILVACLAVFRLSELLGHGAVVVLKTLLVLLTFGLAAALVPWRRAPVLTGTVVLVEALAADLIDARLRRADGWQVPSGCCHRTRRWWSCAGFWGRAGPG